MCVPRLSGETTSLSAATPWVKARRTFLDRGRPAWAEDASAKAVPVRKRASFRLVRRAFRLLLMRTETAVAVLVAVCSATRLGAQSPPAVSQQDMENAAVKYLRADAALRQSYALAPDAAAK